MTAGRARLDQRTAAPTAARHFTAASTARAAMDNRNARRGAWAWLPAGLACVGAAVALLLLSPPGPAAGRAAEGAVEVVFTYGSEKEEWINDVTPAFNALKLRTRSGRPITVRAVPMGSGECVDEV